MEWHEVRRGIWVHLACAVPLQVPYSLICNWQIGTGALWPLIQVMLLLLLLLLLQWTAHAVPLQHGLLHWLSQRLTPVPQLLLFQGLLLLELATIIASLWVGRWVRRWVLRATLVVDRWGCSAHLHLGLLI